MCGRSLSFVLMSIVFLPHRSIFAFFSPCFLCCLITNTSLYVLCLCYVQIIEKTLYVIYANMDFFTGETRIDVRFFPPFSVVVP